MNQEKIIVANRYPFWILLLHPDYLESAKGIAGKWVYHDHPDKLKTIAERLVDLIEMGLTTEIKYRPTLNRPKGPYAGNLPPLCVYSTKENKPKIERILKEKGLEGIYWQSNEATEENARRVKEGYLNGEFR